MSLLLMLDNITITTPFSNAWYVFIKSTLYGTESDLHSTYTEQRSYELNFLRHITVNVNFKIINIKAQIGPGWVE